MCKCRLIPICKKNLNVVQSITTGKESTYEVKQWVLPEIQHVLWTVQINIGI